MGACYLVTFFHETLKNFFLKTTSQSDMSDSQGFALVLTSGLIFWKKKLISWWMWLIFKSINLVEKKIEFLVVDFLEKKQKFFIVE